MENESKELVVLNDITNEDIKSLIYTVRRFPARYCFQLTEEEYISLRSQFATLKNNRRREHKKYLPYVYTEQGISMLSGLLKNDIAIQVN